MYMAHIKYRFLGDMLLPLLTTVKNHNQSHHSNKSHSSYENINKLTMLNQLLKM